MKEESVTRYNPEIISGMDKRSLPEFIYEQNTLDSPKKKDRNSSRAKHIPNGDVSHRNNHHNDAKVVDINGGIVKGNTSNGDIMTKEQVHSEINGTFNGLDEVSVEHKATDNSNGDIMTMEQVNGEINGAFDGLDEVSVEDKANDDRTAL